MSGAVQSAMPPLGGLSLRSRLYVALCQLSHDCGRASVRVDAGVLVEMLVRDFGGRRTTLREVGEALDELEDIGAISYYHVWYSDVFARFELFCLVHEMNPEPQSGYSKTVPIFPPDPEGARGFVYLFRADVGAYKIGKARNLANRAHALNGLVLPLEIEFIHAIETTDRGRLERFLHRAFAEYRIKGEWFRLPAVAVLAFQSLTFVDADHLVDDGGLDCLLSPPVSPEK